MPHQGKKVDEGCSRRARLDGEGGCSVGELDEMIIDRLDVASVGDVEDGCGSIPLEMVDKVVRVRDQTIEENEGLCELERAEMDDRANIEDMIYPATVSAKALTIG